MKRLFYVLVASILIVGSVGESQALAAEKPAVRLEFKRAETKPAKGLEEATVPKTGEKVYVPKAADVTNDDIAEVTIDETDKSSPLLSLKFTKQGQKKMKKLTTEHMDKPMAVLLDGKVLVAPTIQSILSERAVISGIPREQMEQIVKGLKAK